MIRFLGPDLWRELRQLCKARQQRRAAIAYLSSDTYVRFGKRDQIVVNASEAAIRSGQTSAKVLKEAFRRRAKLFHNPKLHAKVFLLDRYVLVGSANLSASSQGLKEAALLTDQPAVVGGAETWFTQLVRSSARIDKKFLERLMGIVVVRRGGRAPAKPTLLEALEQDLPILSDFVYSGIGPDATLEEAYVRRTAIAKNLLMKGVTLKEWNWSERDYAPGLEAGIRKVYRGRPCIYLEEDVKPSGEILRFTGLGKQAGLYVGTWRDRSQGDVIVHVELQQRAPGLRLSGRGWPQELCQVLTRGLEKSPPLRARLSRRRTADVTLGELKQLFAAGRKE